MTDILGQSDSLANRGSTNLNPIQEMSIVLDDIFNDPNFDNATWGVLIKSLKTGEVLYKKNENKLFVPASVLKLFTTASSLLLLGSNYQYYTDVYSNGKIQNGILEGDLIIRGTGDPTFSNRFFDRNTDIFESWADSLLQLGIKEISGDIIGDDNLFDDLEFGKGWAWDYESHWFAAPTSALSFNDNSVDISIEPSSVDMPAYFTISPQTKFVDVINNVKTVDQNRRNGIRVYRGRGRNLITVYGNINMNDRSITKFVSINKPTLYFITVLSEVLDSKGIKIKGHPTDFDGNILKENYDDFHFLFRHKSPDLTEIINEINKNSNNFCAEQLIKSLGLELFGSGSIVNGVNGMKDLLNIMGINPDNLVIADGSGLSRLNLLTPNQIVNLLGYMYKSNEFQNFYESLPIAGIDGTLANRMNYEATENNVRAKSGFIEGVNSLAGYLKTADGEQVAFT
ncbi:D-alanyl-D-alanine carboxypeptidase/D-alanyl-D-alanine-endopeptidase, partial [Bacteroidota bacterium]